MVICTDPLFLLVCSHIMEVFMHHEGLRQQYVRVINLQQDLPFGCSVSIPHLQALELGTLGDI